MSYPTLLEGRVIIGTNGLPIALIWLHENDILIHSPALGMPEKALAHIMLTTIKVRLIRQPSKTFRPSQRVLWL